MSTQSSASTGSPPPTSTVSVLPVPTGKIVVSLIVAACICHVKGKLKDSEMEWDN